MQLKWEEKHINFVNLTISKQLYDQESPTNQMWNLDNGIVHKSCQFLSTVTYSLESFPIPAAFSHFTVYNLPKLSKDKKRKPGNMSSVVLKTPSQSLFDDLQCTFWKKLSWVWLHIYTS